MIGGVGGNDGKFDPRKIASEYTDDIDGKISDPILRKRQAVTGGFAVVTEANSDNDCKFENYLNLIIF